MDSTHEPCSFVPLLNASRISAAANVVATCGWHQVCIDCGPVPFPVRTAQLIVTKMHPYP